MFTSISHKTLAAFEVATALVLGITLTTVGSAGTLAANLSGGGATVLDSAAGMHGAAFAPQYESAAAAWQLTLGLLLILLGFFLHAYMMAKDERPVRVKAGKKSKSHKRSTKSHGLWYWMEMKV
jgi:hypothetical protein